MPAKVSKEKANYRKAEKEERSCETCSHFRGRGNYKGTCTVVRGQVDGMYTSDLWSMSRKSPYRAR